MKYKKVLIVLLSLLLLIFVITKLTKTYPVIITDRISQHPHHFYPKTKRSYDSLLYGIFPFILELPSSTTCKFSFVGGNIEKVVLDDGSSTTKQNYTGFHMFSNKLYCIK